MRHLFKTSAIGAFLLLAACGQTSADETKADVKQPEAATPQVGDKIPEPDAETAAPEVSERGAREIGWEDLMPEGEEERLAEIYQKQMASLYSRGGIAEGSVGDQAVQIGTFNTVTELDGQSVRIPGYTVPLDFGADAEITEFLLVPYYGACIHAPPPPPNQTIYIKTDKPIKLRDLSQAVWVEGVLTSQKQTSDLADTAYTIEMTFLEPYTY